jgi:hypothetical protein
MHKVDEPVVTCQDSLEIAADLVQQLLTVFARLAVLYPSDHLLTSFQIITQQLLTQFFRFDLDGCLRVKINAGKSDAITM